MTTAVDSMVLIDLFQKEPKWAPRAATAIDHAIRSGRLVACDVVWAEVAGRFSSDDVLAAAMAELSVEFEGITERFQRRLPSWRSSCTSGSWRCSIEARRTDALADLPVDYGGPAVDPRYARLMRVAGMEDLI